MGRIELQGTQQTHPLRLSADKIHAYGKLSITKVPAIANTRGNFCRQSMLKRNPSMPEKGNKIRLTQDRRKGADYGWCLFCYSNRAHRA